MQRNSPGGNTRRRASIVTSRYDDTLFTFFFNFEPMHSTSVQLMIVNRSGDPIVLLYSPCRQIRDIQCASSFLSELRHCRLGDVRPTKTCVTQRFSFRKFWRKKTKRELATPDSRGKCPLQWRYGDDDGHWCSTVISRPANCNFK